MPNPLPPVGAQLIVFGKVYPVAEHFDRILDCLAAAGFTATEGGVPDPVATREKLAARNMRLAGSHTTVRPLTEKLDELADYLLRAGAADLCNSGYLDWKHDTLDRVRHSCELLNEAGRKLRSRGIHLHYHNHAFEFETRFEGRTIMDWTIELLDPEACDLCVDVAWVYRGGEDPVAFLRRHKDRIGYIHLKDWDGTHWAELGRGKVPIAECLEAVRENPRIRWVIWEEDQSQIDPFEAATVSGRYLKSIGAL
ncbi:MAG: sugar phosphate isomerase/epimerase family protein [Tepidisphaerales bacterium]